MTRRRDEQGFVLVTAMIVLAVFMMLTVAMVTIVDVQTNQTGHERSGEAAFEIADSALQAEAYQVQLAWPDIAAKALPACNQSSAQSLGCEGAKLSQELASTPGPDYGHATWSAQAFDDNSSVPARYSTSLLTGAAWDANNDERMWVRATATANGQTRTVVEQVMRRMTSISLPQNLVTANAVYTSNDGNKIIMEATDPAAGVTGTVDVRCTAAGPVYGQGNCLGWDAGKGELDPAGTSGYTSGYVDPTGTSSTLTLAQINGLIATAEANHTLFTGCPPDPTSGTVVVTGAVACSYSISATSSASPTPWNSPSAPGALIFLNNSASVTFGGDERFYGVLYMANQNGSPPPCSLSGPTLATVHGGAQLYGAVFADGCGVVNAGDSANNLNFSLGGLGGLQSYQTATPVQGTFQVVPH